jgi:hypothetical protein
MARLPTVIVVLALVGCTQDRAKVEERVAYWKSSLDQEVPAGSNTEKANDWGARHSVRLTYLEQQRWLYANVEQLPASGIPFPCSAWNVIVKIALDPAGRTVKNEVDAVGSCL